jgi:hypothetical protein
MPGGQPVFLPMQYAPQQGYPAAQRPQAKAPAPQPTTVRGQMPGKEEARPKAAASAPLSIPTPEQLGVGAMRKLAATTAPVAQRPAEVDWAATRKKLQELGAVSFRLDQLPAGRARFQVWLPTQAAAVQADGASEADAVRDCLDRARTQVALGH